jgi:hypothetical protein
LSLDSTWSISKQERKICHQNPIDPISENAMFEPKGHGLKSINIDIRF